MRAVHVVAALAALVACRDHSDREKVDELVAYGSAQEAALKAGKLKPRLFQDGELAGWQGALAASTELNKARTCPAPSVTDRAAPGPSTPEVAAWFHPAAELAPCADRIEALVSAGKVLEDEVAHRSPAIVDIDQACGAVVEARLDAAAAHAAGCSPYQLGVGAWGDAETRELHLAYLAVLHAELVAERGDPKRGLQLLVEAIRTVEDATRGDVSLLTRLVVVSSIGAFADAAGWIASAAGSKLTPTALALIEARVDALIAASPPYADTLAGERERFEMSFSGGDTAGSSAIDQQDQLATLFAAGEAAAALGEQACPERASLAACVAGLTKVGGDIPEDVGAKGRDALAAQWAALQQSITAGSAYDIAATRKTVRDGLVNALLAKMKPMFTRYPKKVATGLVHLVALRIQLAAIELGRCPVAAELKPLAAPDTLGAAVVATPGRAGGLDIAAPSELGLADDADKIHVECK